MEKIPTIFDRDWDGTRGVVDKPVRGLHIAGAVATEKLDGTNVRLTVRNGLLVRVEARMNPNKEQKHAGINDPWYRDAWSISQRDGSDPGDQHLLAAAWATDLEGVPDGEWSGEAIGPKIQGNPLELDKPRVVFFTLGMAPIIFHVPHGFDDLREWLPRRRSALNPECGIEGVVWHLPLGHPVGKIKVVDFK